MKRAADASPTPRHREQSPWLDKMPTPVRIAIDARKLHDYGIGTYVRNLLRHLARLDDDDEYVVLCRAEDRGVAAELGRELPRRRRSGPAPYSIREQFAVPLRLRRERADLFHAPHYVLPPLTPCRSVVTIHDCIHLRFPQYLPNRLATPTRAASCGRRRTGRRAS